MKTRKPPMRRCAGCMESKPKNELVRITCYEGEVRFDPSGRANGRGVYLCPSEECFAKAKKRRSLQRSLGTEISGEQVELLLEEIRNFTGESK